MLTGNAYSPIKVQYKSYVVSIVIHIIIFTKRNRSRPESGERRGVRLKSRVLTRKWRKEGGAA